jgi:hypothetical protein
VFARVLSEPIVVQIEAGGSASSSADLPTFIHALPEIGSRGGIPAMRVAISRRLTFQHVGEEDTGTTGLSDECDVIATCRRLGLKHDRLSVLNQEGSFPELPTSFVE